MGAFRIFSRFAELLDIKVVRGAASWLRLNTDGTVTERTAAETRGDLGAAALAGGNSITGAQTIEHSANPVIDIRRTTSSTNSIAAGTNITAVSSGDVTDGFGPTIGFRFSDTGVSNNLIGAIGFLRTGADDTGDFVVRPQVSGSATERFRVAANGTTTVVSLATTPDTRSGAGAVSVTTSCTLVTTTGAAQALTLANGTAGQIKTIIHDVDGGDFILTPTTATGYTTIASSAAGDSITLQYVTTRGWIILALRGAIAA
jgi:hypothetical protein